METDVTYPVIKKYSSGHRTIIFIFRWLFVIAAVACVGINIYTRGHAWSAVVVLAMWWVYRQFIEPDIASYNRISQFVKGTAYLCVMLIVIAAAFGLNWTYWFNFVMPLVIFPALVVLAILLFSDFRKQRYNVMPLIIFDFYCLVGAIIVLGLNGFQWAVFVLMCVSLALLVASIATMRGSILQEIRKYFSIK